jgi:hypothetical protein
VVAEGLMPPWHHDTAYNSFQNEIVLTKTEKETLLKWAASPQNVGDLKKLKYPEFNVKAQDQPDLVFTMDKKYTVKAKLTDEFTWFQIPYVFKDTAYLKSVYLKTASPKIEHHSEVFSNSFVNRPRNIWPSDSVVQIPIIKTEMASTETSGSLFSDKKFVAGRFPATEAWVHPKGIVDCILPGRNLMFFGHYGPVSVDEEDSATVEIKFTNKNLKNRTFYEFGVHGFHDLINGPFFIPKDTVITFYCEKVIDKDCSAFLVLPHAHHICTKMLVYATSAEGKTIPILKLDQWHFEWQFLYKFKKFIVLKKGTKIHFSATYDNTANNPANPNSPPRDIRTSMNANDEMMDLFIHVVPYRLGDENKVLEYDY